MNPQLTARRLARPVDESMNLLNDVSRDALDPAYAAASPRRRRWWMVGLAVLVIGLMIGGSVADQLRAAPAEQLEREQLIQRVEQAAAASDAQRERITQLTRENRALSDGALANDPGAAQVQGQIDQLDPVTGMHAVTGPGVVLVADDAQDAQRSGSSVVDIDIRQAVNGLWQAGAEAIAVNGRRLTSLSAIVNSDIAIQVNKGPLSPPYVVQAIGGTNLQADLVETDSGLTFFALAEQFGFVVQRENVSSLLLPAAHDRAT